MADLDSDEYDWWRRLSRINMTAASWQNTTGGGDFVAAAPVTDTLVKHLEGNKLIHDSQHGFRTNLLAFHFLDRVIGCIDTGDSVDVVFLDFE